MKMKEFNLSEKIRYTSQKCIYPEDIKEFIKRLKEQNISWKRPPQDNEFIDKLVGDKLSGKLYNVLLPKDVKEFIKRLKDKIYFNGKNMANNKSKFNNKEIKLVQDELSRVMYQIDSLAGDKLSGKPIDLSEEGLI